MTKVRRGTGPLLAREERREVTGNSTVKQRQSASILAVGMKKPDGKCTASLPGVAEVLFLNSTSPGSPTGSIHYPDQRVSRGTRQSRKRLLGPNMALVWKKEWEVTEQGNYMATILE